MSVTSAPAPRSFNLLIFQFLSIAATTEVDPEDLFCRGYNDFPSWDEWPQPKASRKLPPSNLINEKLKKEQGMLGRTKTSRVKCDRHQETIIMGSGGCWPMKTPLWILFENALGFVFSFFLTNLGGRVHYVFSSNLLAIVYLMPWLRPELHPTLPPLIGSHKSGTDKLTGFKIPSWNCKENK